MGSYQPCNRRHCRHDLTQHRRSMADSGPRRGQLLIGACHHERCQCAQYVQEGLQADDRLLGVYGDAGEAATLELLALGLPIDRDDPLREHTDHKPNSTRTPRPEVGVTSRGGLWLPESYRE